MIPRILRVLLIALCWTGLAQAQNYTLPSPTAARPYLLSGPGDLSDIQARMSIYPYPLEDVMAAYLRGSPDPQTETTAFFNGLPTTYVGGKGRYLLEDLMRYDIVVALGYTTAAQQQQMLNLATGFINSVFGATPANFPAVGVNEGNLWLEDLIALGLAALNFPATTGPTANPYAQQWLNQSIAYLQAEINAEFLDGYGHEQPRYHTWELLLLSSYLTVLNRNCQLDIYNTTPALKQGIEWFCRFGSPPLTPAGNLPVTPSWGDSCYAEYSGVNSTSLIQDFYVPALFAPAYSTRDPYFSQRLMYFWQKAASPVYAGEGWGVMGPQLFDPRLAASPQAPRCSYYAPTLGAAIMRVGTESPNEMVATFLCGQPGITHEDSDNGHIDLFAFGVPLALDSMAGPYANQDFGADSTDQNDTTDDTWNVKIMAHNTVRFQGTEPTSAIREALNGKFNAFGSSTIADYVSGYTNYNTNTQTGAVRHVVVVKPDYLVVWDECGTAQSYSDFWLHTPAQTLVWQDHRVTSQTPWNVNLDVDFLLPSYILPAPTMTAANPTNDADNTTINTVASQASDPTTPQAYTTQGLGRFGEWFNPNDNSLGENPFSFPLKYQMYFTVRADTSSGNYLTVWHPRQVGSTVTSDITSTLVSSSNTSVTLTVAFNDGSRADTITISTTGATVTKGGVGTVQFAETYPQSGVSGPATLTKSQYSTLTLTSPVPANGPVEVTMGTVALGSSNLLQDTTPLNLRTGGTFALGSYGQTVASLLVDGGTLTGTGSLAVGTIDYWGGTLSAPVAATGSLTKDGASIWSPPSNVTYAGDTIINSGTLQVPSSGLPGTQNVQLTQTGAALDLNGSSQPIASLNGVTGSTVNINSGALNVAGGASSTFSGDITGAGGLTVSGSGHLTLSGVLSYTGATTVASGSTLTLQPASGSAANFPTSGLVVWLDASNASTITQSGGFVTSWQDQSGNGNHFTQATTGNQPAYVTGATPLASVVRFNGSSTQLVELNPISVQTLFIVTSVTQLTSNQGLWGSSVGTFGIRMQDNPFTAWETAQTSPTDTTLFLNAANSQCLVNGVVTNGATASVFSTHEAQVLTAIRSAAYNFSDNCLGSQVFSGTTRYYNGDIAEVLAYNGLLSASDQQEVQNYLMQKWGISGSYASGVGEGLGALPPGTQLSVQSGGVVNLGAQNQTVSSLASAADGTVNMNGTLTIAAAGGDPNAVFAGHLAGSGTLINNGTLALTGNATLPSGLNFTNNGTLNISNWNGTLPTNFINNGTVLAPAAITTQPLSQTALLGHNAQFSATVIGTGQLNYQWYFNNVALSNGTPANSAVIAGATTATLSLTNLYLANAGTYTLQVTNPNGTITSQPALLTILGTSPTGEVANDPFTDGSFTNLSSASGADPFGLVWYESAAVLSIASDNGSPGIGMGNALQVAPPGTFGRAIGQFPTVALVNPGDYVKLQFAIRFPNIAAGTSTGSLRFGLFNNNGTPTSANGGSSNLTGSLTNRTDDFGYGALTDILGGASDTHIFYQPAQNSAGADILSGNTTSFSASGSGANAAALGNTSHQITLQITLNADRATVTVSATFDSTPVSGTTTTATPGSAASPPSLTNSSSQFAFNEIGITNGGTENTFLIDNVIVATNATPTVAITVPTTSTTYSTYASSLALSGTASGSQGVTQVEWLNNGNEGGVATTSNSWSNWNIPSVPLVPGSNAITVSAQDSVGNTASALLTVTQLVAGTIQFSPTASYSANESAAAAAFTVTRTGGSSGAVGVSYTTSDGTAAAGTDYTATSGTLNWADGDSTPKTFSVPFIPDAVTNGNLTFNVTLSNPTNNATLGTPPTETYTVEHTASDHWRFVNFGANAANAAISGPLANPSGDGIVNLLKYALGLNPLINAAAGMPTVSQDGTNIYLNYTQVIGATDITYQPQWSSDLAIWNTTGIGLQVLSGNSTSQQMQAAVPLNGTGQIFMRLNVIQP